MQSFFATHWAGHLTSVDSYMNIQLENSEEWIDGALAGKLGEILIRCNNVLYIRPGLAAATPDKPAPQPTTTNENALS